MRTLVKQIDILFNKIGYQTAMILKYKLSKHTHIIHIHVDYVLTVFGIKPSALNSDLIK